MQSCTCELLDTPPLVVVTGGPGAGKTAVLEVLQRELCPHVVVLPEAASILWRGGFPRRRTLPARRAAQRAIVHLQLELQRLALEEGRASLIVCDRGTLDGIAYWPGDAEGYFADLGTTREAEYARYAAVIQLRPPSYEHGYRPSDVRTETASEAAEIDARIFAAWSGHPRHVVVDASADFLKKVHETIALIRHELPSSCRASAAWPVVPASRLAEQRTA